MSEELIKQISAFYEEAGESRLIRSVANLDLEKAIEARKNRLDAYVPLVAFITEFPPEHNLALAKFLFSSRSPLTGRR